MVIDAAWDKSLEQECAALRAENERLRAALELIEWSRLVNESEDINDPLIIEHCPWCGLSRSAGHEPSCPVGIALGHPRAALEADDATSV